MDLTAVLTYQNGSVVLLGCNQIARINQSKKAIIVNGHWHGGGGSGAEWTVWKKKGNSMYDTYHDGQHLFFVKTDKIERNDIVIFDKPNEDKYLIKRVIAAAGDTIYAVNNQVYVNDVPLDESAYVTGYTTDFDAGIISEGCIFVMGDNRENSNDSRYFGEVPLDRVVGKVWKQG